MTLFLQTLKNLLKNPSSKKIEFSLMDKYKIENTTKDFWVPPVSAMKRIPEWYKKMSSRIRNIQTWILYFKLC